MSPMKAAEAIQGALAKLPRLRLATLPTPLEEGPRLPGGARLLVKRDDLSGLGMGGNKARKLEFLCGEAGARDVDTVVTVGAAQSNHARMTAAACARLGWDAHLVLGRGEATEEAAGNQLLARLFGASLHVADTDDWGQLQNEAETLAADLTAAGRRVQLIPMGGSTPTGALGFMGAWAELLEQCEQQRECPSAVVTASSTSGTHGGLLAGQSFSREAGSAVPDLIAVGVAKGATDLASDSVNLARDALAMAGLTSDGLSDQAPCVEGRMVGAGYAVPTEEADAAILWAARRGGWVLDRVYTGKAFAGLLMLDREGRFPPDQPVIFWHTGGQPALFAPGGVPDTGVSI